MGKTSALTEAPEKEGAERGFPSCSEFEAFPGALSGTVVQGYGPPANAETFGERESPDKRTIRVTNGRELHPENLNPLVIKSGSLA